MISLIGNTIKIPQGDSGAVTFYFKEKNTDFPLILGKLHPGYEDDIQSAFRFTVRKAPDKSSELAMDVKNYILPDNTRYGEYRHDEEEVVVKEGEEEKTVKEKKDTLFRRFDMASYATLPENGEKEKDILYAILETESGAYSFKYISYLDEEEFDYDYINSSLTVTFDRNDTVNLPYRQYYYEITYLEGYNLGTDDEKIMKSVSLQNLTPFIVTGALN